MPIPAIHGLHDSSEIDAESDSDNEENALPKLLGDGNHPAITVQKRKFREMTQDNAEAEPTRESVPKRRKSVRFDSGTKPETQQVAFAGFGNDIYNDDSEDDSGSDFEPDYDAEGTSSEAASTDTNSSYRSDDKVAESDTSSISSLAGSSDVSSSSLSETSSQSSSSDEKSSDASPEGAKSSSKPSLAHAPLNKIVNSVSGLEPEKNSDSTQPNKSSTPLGQGLHRTTVRNQRRRDSKKLRYLKRVGRVDENATLADLRELKKASPNNEAGKDGLEDTGGDAPAERPDAQISAGFRDVNNKESQKVAFKRQRERLLSALASGGIDIDLPLSSGLSQNDDQDENGDGTSSTKRADPSTDNAATTTEQPTRKARLDVDSSRRMFFGSLGYRAPKNMQEAEAIRSKVMDSAKRLPVQKPTTGSAVGSSDEVPGKSEGHSLPEANVHDPDFWKTRINLSAVECIEGKEENDELPPPPFPFKQRWGFQKVHRAADGNSFGKKRKRKGRQALETENHAYANHNQANGTNGNDPEKIILDYDDGNVIDLVEAQEAEKGHDSSGSNLNSYATTSTIAAADLPLLPSDPSTLLTPTDPGDLQAGAIIAFTQLELSAATNWEPRISAFKTARIEKVGDDDDNANDKGSGSNGSSNARGGSTLTLRLARRDWPPKREVQVDGEGRRVYGKFEMGGFDNDDDRDDDYGGGGGGDDDDGARKDENGNEGDEHDLDGEGEPGTVDRNGKMVVQREELMDLKLVRAAV